MDYTGVIDDGITGTAQCPVFSKFTDHRKLEDGKGGWLFRKKEHFTKIKYFTPLGRIVIQNMICGLSWITGS